VGVIVGKANAKLDAGAKLHQRLEAPQLPSSLKLFLIFTFIILYKGWVINRNNKLQSCLEKLQQAFT
jgi:hypothetical protein